MKIPGCVWAASKLAGQDQHGRATRFGGLYFHAHEDKQRAVVTDDKSMIVCTWKSEETIETFIGQSILKAVRASMLGSQCEECGSEHECRRDDIEIVCLPNTENCTRIFLGKETHIWLRRLPEAFRYPDYRAVLAAARTDSCVNQEFSPGVLGTAMRILEDMGCERLSVKASGAEKPLFFTGMVRDVKVEGVIMPLSKEKS